MRTYTVCIQKQVEDKLFISIEFALKKRPIKNDEDY
jgi:hypothetical protein